MKNWMMVAVLFVLGTQSVMAQKKNGSPVKHVLNCQPKDNKNALEGVDYQMICYTAALAPQYSLRGCDLYETVVMPNSKPRLISLAQETQTASSALLVNEYEKIKVKVKKYPLVAQVKLSSGYKLICSVKPPLDGGGMSAGN